MRCAATALFLLLASSLPVSFAAHAVAADEVPPWKWTLHAAAPARDVLKYQLLPPFAARITGNAAVYYGKVTAEQQGVFGNRPLLDKIDDWREKSLDDLRQQSEDLPTQGIERMLARAARCTYCDWQLPIRDENYFELLLPEVQQTRSFARILCTRARLQIAQGKFDEAIATFQSCLALGRNVAQSETLVSGLVGLAICGVTFDQLQEFIQQPGAPNLYWALTTLPHPIVDMRPGVEGELYGLGAFYPPVDLAQARGEGEWHQLLEQFWNKILKIADESAVKHTGAAGIIAASLAREKEARQALLDRGTPAEKVAAMSPAQVVYINTLQQFAEQRDERFCWLFVPYPQGVEHLRAIHARDAANNQSNDTPEVLVRLMMPALSAIYDARARVDRNYTLLRVSEALRLHAAGHENRLPAQLTDVTAVPIPLDPVTGKPFDYHLQGDTAVISLTPLVGQPARLEIQLAK